MLRRPYPWLLVLLSLLLTSSFSCTSSKSKPKLVVYAYDSFVGENTLGALLAEEFRREQSADVEYVVFPDAGQALNQVVLEGAKTRADLVVGIDGALFARAVESGSFAKLDPKVLAPIPARLRFDSENRFVPFDYGYLAILHDSRRTPAPSSEMTLRQFAREPKFAKRVALQDPRTSSIGLGFLLWTQKLYAGPEFDAFWRDMSARARTVSPGWSAAYGLFLKKEVDFVVSYTTSPAYHVEKEKNGAIRALVFKEGSLRQIEAVGLTVATKQKELAKKWIALLLSPSIQAKLPTLQWMYPARDDVSLPESFRKLSVPAKALDPDPIAAGADRAQWLKRWTSAMAGVK